MGKRLKVTCTLLCVVCLTLGTTVIIFAKSKVDTVEELSSVNPHMAVVSAALMAVAGAIIFIKRNKSDGSDAGE